MDFNFVTNVGSLVLVCFIGFFSVKHERSRNSFSQDAKVDFGAQP